MNKKQETRAVTMLQFLTGKQLSQSFRPLLANARPLSSSTVPQPNQRTHACPPAKPGRNTLLPAPAPHHSQILIQKLQPSLVEMFDQQQQKPVSSPSL